MDSKRMNYYAMAGEKEGLISEGQCVDNGTWVDMKGNYMEGRNGGKGEEGKKKREKRARDEYQVRKWDESARVLQKGIKNKNGKMKYTAERINGDYQYLERMRNKYNPENTFCGRRNETD